MKFFLSFFSRCSLKSQHWLHIPDFSHRSISEQLMRDVGLHLLEMVKILQLKREFQDNVPQKWGLLAGEDRESPKIPQQ